MRQYSPGIYLVFVTVLVVLVTSYQLLSPILLAFLLTLLVSLALNPVVLKLRELTGGRRLATLIITAGFVIGIGLAIWAFIVPIKTSTTKLVQRLPEYWERVQRPLIRLERRAAATSAKVEKEVTSEVAAGAAAKGDHFQAQEVLRQQADGKEQPSPSIRSGLMGLLNGAAGGFKSAASSTAEMAVVLVTVFFGVLFTLMNPRPIFGAIFSLVPAAHHPKALHILQRVAAFVPSWALSTVLGMLVIGLLVFLLMWPIFGFMDALILGVIAGTLEAIPYIGPILSAVPALLLGLGQGGMTPLWVLLSYIGVQALENNVILPFVMARGMKLHPVAVIFSMLLCVAAFGVLGVLIAAPMVAIVQILHDELYRPRFLPGVASDDLQKLARRAMKEKPASESS